MAGFLGVCSRGLAGYGFGPYETALVRSLVTVVGLLAIMAVWRRDLFRAKIRDMWLFALFGVSKFLSDVTFFFAQSEISLGLATLLQMTSPFYVLALSYFMFRENVTYRKILAMFLAFFGLMLVCDVITGAQDMSYVGVMCGIASGFFFAIYMIGGKVTVDRGYHPMTVILYIFIFSLVVNLPFADIGTVASAFSVPEALGYILFMGILLTLFPFLTDVWSVRVLSPTVVSMIGTLEAVSAAVVGWAFYGESMSMLNIVGMAVVIGSVLLINIRVSRSLMSRKR